MSHDSGIVVTTQVFISSDCQMETFKGDFAALTDPVPSLQPRPLTGRWEYSPRCLRWHTPEEELGSLVAFNYSGFNHAGMHNQYLLILI